MAPKTMKFLVASAAMASVTGMVAPAAQNARPAAQNARLRVGGSAPGAGMGAPPPGTAAGARYAQETWGNAPYAQQPPPEYEPAPASVSEKVDSLLNELGYAEAEGPLDQKIAMAVKELGMEKEVASMKMVEKVDACLATLGMIVASRRIEGEPGQGYDQQFAGAPGPYGGPMRGGRDPYSNYFSNSRAVNDGSVTGVVGRGMYGPGYRNGYEGYGYGGGYGYGRGYGAYQRWHDPW